MICRSCELPVSPDEQQPDCKEGIVYHRICYSLAVTSLAHDLDVWCRDNPGSMAQLLLRYDGDKGLPISPEQARTVVIKCISDALEKWRISYNNEKEFQESFGKLLTENGLAHRRELSITKANRPDFFIDPGIAVELKIKGSIVEILRQLRRYAEVPQVSHIVLVCPRPYDVPSTLNGKPVTCIPMWMCLL